MISTLLSCTDAKKEGVPKQTKDYCSQLHAIDSADIGASLAPLADSLEKKSAALVLEDGGNAMMARAWLCEHAKTSIDIQYFIFATDNVGLIACDFLVRAADRGVKVRLLIDDMLVDAQPYDILSLDAHPNIDIKIYNPGVNLGKNIVQKIGTFATDFQRANQRMHNKTFTVDNKVVITGGRNIADEYFDYDHEYNFRDRDVMLIGPVVETVNVSFENFWNAGLSVAITKLLKDTAVHAVDPNRYERLHQYACNPDNFWPQVRQKITSLPTVFQQLIADGKIKFPKSIRFVSDLPGKNTKQQNFEGGLTTSCLVDIIRRAKKSIDIQSPYLVTTPQMRSLLKAAVQRGVKIRILTNSLASTDNLEAFSGYRRDREAILATGVRVFEFRPDAKVRYEIMTGELQQKVNYTPVFGLHAKTMVVDGETTVIGTFNFDPRSANYNTECLTVIEDADIAKGVVNGMETEFLPENAWETTKEHNPDAYASSAKRVATKARRIVPKGIL